MLLNEARKFRGIQWLWVTDKASFSCLYTERAQLLMGKINIRKNSVIF